MTVAVRSVVLDASVVADLVIPEVPPSAPQVMAVAEMASRGVTFLVPRLLFEEVRNTLLSGIRQRRWDGAAADGAAEQLADLPLLRADHESDLVRAWELSRRYDNHAFYDMLYVAMAERLDVPFLTIDQRLLRRVADLDWVISPGEVGDD